MQFQENKPRWCGGIQFEIPQSGLFLFNKTVAFLSYHSNLYFSIINKKHIRFINHNIVEDSFETD